jgi:hypothetical protein
MIRRICSIDCKSGERPEWYKIMEPVLTNVLYKRHLHTTDSKFKCRIYQIDVSTDMQHDMKRAQWREIHVMGNSAWKQLKLYN